LLTCISSPSGSSLLSPNFVGLHRQRSFEPQKCAEPHESLGAELGGLRLDYCLSIAPHLNKLTTSASSRLQQAEKSGTRSWCQINFSFPPLSFFLLHSSSTRLYSITTLIPHDTSHLNAFPWNIIYRCRRKWKGRVWNAFEAGKSVLVYS
jgi:hypothetical protein